MVLTGKLECFLSHILFFALNPGFIVILKSSTVGEPNRVCARVSKGHSCPPKCTPTFWVMVVRFISVAFQRKVLLVSDQLRTTSGTRQRTPACKFCLYFSFQLNADTSCDEKAQPLACSHSTWRAELGDPPSTLPSSASWTCEVWVHIDPASVNNQARCFLTHSHVYTQKSRSQRPREDYCSTSFTVSTASGSQKMEDVSFLGMKIIKVRKEGMATCSGRFFQLIIVYILAVFM